MVKIRYALTISTLVCTIFTANIDSHSSVDFSSGTLRASSIPKWLQDHMIYMTSGTGRWVADNSKYRSENESYEQYVTEWKWGVGKNSVSGRLFSYRNGEETPNFWEYKLFWHPKEEKAILQQFGGNGIYGVGEMSTLSTAVQTERSVEINFYGPDGSSWKDLHKIYEKKDEHETISFDFKQGIWVERRSYTWKKVVPDPTPETVPDDLG